VACEAAGMRFSVGQYTTARRTFEEDVRIYAEAGAQGIGIDLGLKPIDIGEGVRLLEEGGLEAGFVFGPVNSLIAGERARGPKEPRARLDALCEGVHLVAPFRPATIVFGTGPLRDGDPDAAWAHVVQGFKRVAREAATEGLTVSLEPLHSTLAPHWTFLTDLATTVRLVEEIDEPNLGFLFDVWHLWDSPDVHELLRANVERVFAVHVDDWRDPTRSWADRVLPGDGVADIEGFLRILAEGGYDGWLELEIFSDDGYLETAFPDSLWLRDPVELIRDGRLRTERLWAQATAAGGA
jgi:sugar phosphate isomerase/epimerase